MQVHDWQAIVTDHGPLVWQTAYRLLGEHADTADCFQETFLAAVEISRRQKIHNMSGLLVRLATTRAIDSLRQKGRLEKCRARAPVWQETHNGAESYEHVQSREVVRNLREAIGQLPAQEGKVFCMRYLNDMSYRQIGQQLDMKTTTVGVLLLRARTKLRQMLMPTAAETDEVRP